MTINIRTEIVCDWCSKKVLLPRGISDRLNADYSKPKGWITIEHGYGNCTHYCCELCKTSSMNELGLIDGGE